MRGRATVIALFALGATALGAQTQLVIVSGLGGAPAFTQAFGALGNGLAQAAFDRAKIPDSAIAWLGEQNAPKTRWYRGASTKENIEQTLARIAARRSEDQVVVVLIGHGSGEGRDTRISLPGADLTAADFARLLSAFGNRRVAFVNLTSASGDMLPVVAGPNRVVITATKSAFERNESQFGRFFVDALSKDGADTDKDGRVSLLEAFKYAESETKRFYETESRLATEHPQMADDGQLARRFYLAGGRGSAVSAASPALNALYAEKFSLDEQIGALKRRKAEMTADAYDDELEKLLLALARKSREIRELERGS